MQLSARPYRLVVGDLGPDARPTWVSLRHPGERTQERSASRAEAPRTAASNELSSLSAKRRPPKRLHTHLQDRFPLRRHPFRVIGGVRSALVGETAQPAGRHRPSETEQPSARIGLCDETCHARIARASPPVPAGSLSSNSGCARCRVGRRGALGRDDLVHWRVLLSRTGGRELAARREVSHVGRVVQVVQGEPQERRIRGWEIVQRRWVR
jgi:hypothetical protein